MPRPAWIILEAIPAQVQTPGRTHILPQEEARRLSLEVPGGHTRAQEQHVCCTRIGHWPWAGIMLDTSRLISFLPDDPLERRGQLVSLYSLGGKTEAK